jgi:hypothetical protein
MPFGGWGDDYYDSIYIPAIEACGLQAHRADDLFRPSTIVNDIWAYTKRAKILLADLTGKNPNVFYELGLAHALAKPAIIVAESMEEIPFDLRALRIITYDKNDPEWGKILKEKLESSIKEVLKSPIEAVLPAFLEVKDEKPKISSHEKEILEIKQELDLLKRSVRSVPFERPEVQHPHRLIDPIEARNRIRDYLSNGMPDGLIINRLSEMGIQIGWIKNEISRFKERMIMKKKVKSSSKRKK